MKSIVTIGLLATITVGMFGQNQKFYDGNHGGQKADASRLEIKFSDSGTDLVEPASPESTLASLIGVGLDFGFTMIDSALDKRSKSFVHESAGYASYVKQTNRVPDFKVVREVYGISDESKALEMVFSAEHREVNKQKLYHFKLDPAHSTVDLTAARLKRFFTTDGYIDLSVELIPEYYTKDADGNWEKKTVELQPIQVEGLKVGEPNWPEELTSEQFMLPKDAIFVGLQVKITESNPKKISAALLLDFWMDSKQELRKYIDGRLGISDSGSATSGSDGDGDGNSGAAGDQVVAPKQGAEGK